MGSKKLNKLLTKVGQRIPQHQTLNLEVSASNAGWHIEHILLVIEKIIEALKTAEPKNYKWQFNLIRSIVFATHKIPRGKGKSPKAVLPKNYDAVMLTEHYAKVERKVDELESISKDNYFKHPVFGDLRLLKTITFLEIHTKHHLKIIDDILS